MVNYFSPLVSATRMHQLNKSVVPCVLIYLCDRRIHKATIIHTSNSMIFRTIFPPSLYKLPSEIFNYLQMKGKLDATIGRLKNEADINSVISETTANMERDALYQTYCEIADTTEIKECGHVCVFSGFKTSCCTCADTTIHNNEKKWISESERRRNYCPACKMYIM